LQNYACCPLPAALPVPRLPSPFPPRQRDLHHPASASPRVGVTAPPRRATERGRGPLQRWGSGPRAAGRALLYRGAHRPRPDRQTCLKISGMGTLHCNHLIWKSSLWIWRGRETYFVVKIFLLSINWQSGLK